MIKRSIYYVTRKKKRSLIIMMILTIILSCLYISSSITIAATQLEKTMYEAANTSLSVTKKDQSLFDYREYKEIKQAKGYTLYYEGLTQPRNLHVIEAQQSVKRDDLSDEYKNVMSYLATNQTKSHALFKSGNFVLKEGRHIQETDCNKVMVHEQFAKKNHLVLHDFINLDNNKKYEIIGIFSGKKQERYTGLTSDFSENMLFMDYSSQQTNNVHKIIMYFDHLKDTRLMMKQLEKNHPDAFVEMDTQTYEKTLEAITHIQYIIKVIVCSLIVVALVVLSLILILWLRERLYEIGILLSVGFHKSEILGQFICELLFVSIPAAVLSFGLGHIFLKYVINVLLKNAYSLLLEYGFRQEGMTFIGSYGILAGVIIISVITTCGMFLIKKPQEILSKMS